MFMYRNIGIQGCIIDQNLYSNCLYVIYNFLFVFGSNDVYWDIMYFEF